MKIARVAFLRAINVGGRNVKMDELRSIVSELGFERVQTHIASGNVILESAVRNAERLEHSLERGLEERLGFAVSVFVRDCADLRDLLDRAFAEKPATASNVIFLKKPLDREQMLRLHELANEEDSFEVRGRHIAWLCTVKQSESKFSNAVLERKLKIESTIRTRKTVADIVRLFCS